MGGAGMKRCTVLLSVMLVAGALSLRAADDKDKEDDEKGKVAAGEVKKLADGIAKGGTWEAVSKEGAGLAKAHTLEHVMRTMKLRRKEGLKQGLGIGDKLVVMPDGIEAQLTIAMPKWTALPRNFKDVKADYIRASNITAAVAAISLHQCKEEKTMGEKDPKKWKDWM